MRDAQRIDEFTVIQIAHVVIAHLPENRAGSMADDCLCADSLNESDAVTNVFDPASTRELNRIFMRTA